MQLKPLIHLLRPEQWTKNLFIFLPMFFNGQMYNVSMLVSCTIAFVAFSLAASSIYCFNDVFDVVLDKLHPEKCKRPIASGRISSKSAYIIAVICLGLSIGIMILFGGTTRYTIMILIAFYYIMNIAYSLRLKQYAIIDVIIISIGFVLRLFVGKEATGIWLSEWIIIMTFLLALFLAFSKRRDDVISYQKTGILPRKNTNQYSLELMNQIITIIATITIVAYLMYTLSPDVTARFNSQYVYATTVFVLAGIIRYLQLTTVKELSGNPTKIFLRDRFIQCCIAGWFILFCIIIYGGRL